VLATHEVLLASSH